MPKRVRKIIFVILALLALSGIRVVHRRLNDARRQLELTHTDPLENAPPTLAFTTVALGGFRGLIASVLWFRAQDLQDNGDYFEMLSLSDWITKLQPDIGKVWAIQAWNMTYNISVQFPDFRDRWLWVNSGIELLRDQGLRYNPNDVELYRELAWFYYDKIGSHGDNANNYFKAQLAAEMMSALGGALDGNALLTPKTDEDRRHVALLRERFKLDPAWMKHVDGHYGPFDWRLPEAHAVYWADLGLEKCRNKDDLIQLRRIILRSVQNAVKKGRLVIYTTDRRMEFGPNLDMIPSANRAYEEMKQYEPGKLDEINRGQKVFLRDAICLFYTHNQVANAVKWFDSTKQQFPDAIPANTSVDEFVVGQVTQAVDGQDDARVNALIEGLLGQHFYYRALGDDDQANGYALLVRGVWAHYQTRVTNKKEQDRLGLPALADIQKRVCEQITRGEHGFTPALLAQLRANGGWLGDTNSPIAVDAK